jgi:NADH-quinone oxidoreductase subunit K
MIPVSHYLTLSAILFSIGCVGVFVRRNAIVAFMCIELMFNAVNLTFIALTGVTGNLDGQVAVLFVMVVAAAEAAVGLAIVLSLFRAMKTVETSEVAELKS